MAKFNTGSATIDKFLQIKKADEPFYKFIGEENFYTLAKSCHPDDLARLNQAVEELKDNGHNMLAYRIRRIDGKYRWFLAELEYETVELDGEPLININFQDVQALEREVNEIKSENAELEEFFGLLDELFFVYNIDEDDFRIFIGGSKQKYDIVHCSLDEWIKDVEDKKYIDRRYKGLFSALCMDLRCGTRSFKYEIKSKQFSVNKESELQLIKGKTVRDTSRERRVIGCISTISEESKKKAVNYNVESNKDAGTDLLNKKAITGYAQRLIASKVSNNVHVCIVDLDNFKTINDTYGHMFGDEVLLTVAAILKEAVGDKGMVGRIGGDEMMVILEKVSSNSELRGILRAIRSNIEWAYKGKLDGVNLTASIGVASYPIHADSYDTLFQIADKMLYRAKKKGRNRYVIYTPEVHGDAANLESEEENNIVSVSKNNKESVILKLTEFFLHKQIMPYEVAMSEVGTTFGLGEINVFYDYLDRITMYWGDESEKEVRNIEYVHEEYFSELFNENGIAVIDAVSILENICPITFEYLTGLGVRSAIIYRMQHSRKEGYVAYYKKKSTTRKWSESDKAYLNFIGKIIELTVDDR